MSSSGFAQNAIRYTDREIFAEVMGVNEEDLPGYDGGEDEEHEQELITGWDGEPLSDEEGMANTLRPYDEGDDILTDRPLQLAREQGYEAEIEQRDQQLAEMQERLAQLEAANDPQRQQRAAQQREEAIYGMIQNPDQALNEIGAMHQELQSLKKEGLRASFENAHQEFGTEFEEAATELDALATRANRGDQGAAMEVRSIVNAPDPGYALMQRRHMVNSLSSLPPPFMGGRRGPQRGRPLSAHRTVDLADQDGGFGNENVENDIFDSAFLDDAA